ncbi:MAG: 16S rRNA (cytosine(1402)-N(4))-methyltransferase RsmH [bacterium]|nr:16S rRNA (cytosine(1402)-N(4))-methyltransferase RsmH [bacterium]
MNAESNIYHIPVLAGRVAELLQPAPGKVYADGTLGGGGHAELLLRRGAKVIGFDQDIEAIHQARERLGQYADFTAVHRNFAELNEGLDELGIAELDGILLDLGVSSHQLDEADRGFSFRASAPLDMRMDTQSEVSARDIIERSSFEELNAILRDYGEERYARQIARKIVQERALTPIATTDRLADIVSGAVPAAYRHGRIHPATRTFQALRIAVNDELEALKIVLDKAWKRLKCGGRIAVISYHSLEDRLVKRSFQSLLGKCTCPPGLPVCVCANSGRLKLINSKPIIPEIDEVTVNPRARSAKLRVAERI